MGRKLVTIVSPVLGLSLFSAALWAIHHELRQYHYQDIIMAISSMPAASLVLAGVFTALNYGALICYDILGFRYINFALARFKIAFAAFIAFAFANNIGFYSVSSSAIRYRLYSAWGLCAVDIARVIAFAGILTFWLGLATVCSLVFLLEPLSIPEVFHVPAISMRWTAAAFLALLAAFLLWILLKKKPIRIRGWEFEIPPVGLFLSLIVTACLDWILFCAVLYVLLPEQLNMTFTSFLSFFLLAQVVGLISQIPGGLGVFEAAIILFLPHMQSSSVLGALLVFRALYYLLPLCVATVLLGAHELLQSRTRVTSLLAALQKWVLLIVPHVFAGLTFLSGLVLQYSGSMPPESERLKWLVVFLPLPVLEISHLLGSAIGVALLILAWGVYRRLDAAYHMVLYLLGAGIFISLFKGAEYEEALMLSCMLLLFMPCRRWFYRKTSFTEDHFSTGWVLAVGLVIVSAAWLGMFSYRHIDYAHELWWQFSIDGHVSRFLRASVGGCAVALAFAVFRLFGSARPGNLAPQAEDFEKVRRILSTYPKVSGQLALLGDKSFLFSQHIDAFVMYAVQAKSWVAMGDPVGQPDSAAELAWEFMQLSDRHNGWPVFYEIGGDMLPTYIDLGLTLHKIGEEGRVDLQNYSLDGSSKKGLRRVESKLARQGCMFEIVPREQVPGIIDRLRTISDAWLAEKKTREKRFSMGFFNPQYLAQHSVAIVQQNGEILAFSNILATQNRNELSIDLMRYLPSAPDCVMDYLFINLQQWGRQNGYQWFSLGMAPLSGMDDSIQGSMWMKIGSFLYRHGENFYNFQGLRHYKEKFHPIWEPKYLAAPRGFSLPLILKDISSLISGGMKGVVGK